MSRPPRPRPPAGSGIGQERRHTIHDPRYQTPRPAQILECYTDPHASGLCLYLWTVPSQRAILLAGDEMAGAPCTVRQDCGRT